MPGKMTLSVHDDVHHQNAEGIEYDLWRVDTPTNRVIIKRDRITDENPHLLIQANTTEELGSFEVVSLYQRLFRQCKWQS